MNLFILDGSDGDDVSIGEDSGGGDEGSGMSFNYILKNFRAPFENIFISFECLHFVPK